jgi:gliding motility-associated lipoprotein GldD
MKLHFLFLLIVIFLSSCADDDYTPKPKSYPRVHFPTEKGFKMLEGNYPYTFEYPAYAKVFKDSSFFGKQPENPYWLTIFFPAFNARVHLSYKQINNNENTFYKLLEDTYQLTFKHSVKAEAIDRNGFHSSNGVAGEMFLVRGNAASANQFYVTDSTKNFVRGSLYFYCEPNEDSLMPITKFVFKDIEHIIQTFKWKK